MNKCGAINFLRVGQIFIIELCIYYSIFIIWGAKYISLKRTERGNPLPPSFPYRIHILRSMKISSYVNLRRIFVRNTHAKLCDRNIQMHASGNLQDTSVTSWNKILSKS